MDKEDIYQEFGYDAKMEGYRNSCSDIPKLSEILTANLELDEPSLSIQLLQIRGGVDK